MRTSLLLLLLFIPGCYDPNDEARGFSPALPGSRARYLEESHDPAPLTEAPVVAPTGPAVQAPLPPPQSVPKSPKE